MAKRSLLLVDSDIRSLRVLEVSLKKAGFTVATSASAGDALISALNAPPDLIVTDTRLSDGDGFQLCRRLKADARTARAAVVFLSLDDRAESKVEAINAGADDFVAKPVLVMEIVSRVRSLLEKRQTAEIARRERPGNLSGTLANMGVVDLLQLMEGGQKSGIIHLSSDPARSGGFVSAGEERGTIYFRDGRFVDAHVGKLSGATAVYRMLMWIDGVFEIEFKALSREDLVGTTTQALLLEGMRRIDEWTRLEALLPAMSSRLSVDFGALGSRYYALLDPMKPVLHLFDGKRTILDVVTDSALDDTSVLAAIAELYRMGALHSSDRSAPSHRAAPAAADPTSVEAWLSSPAVPSDARSGASPAWRPEPAGLPSVLGRAVIPSPQTASEILGWSPVRLTPTPSSAPPEAASSARTAPVRQPTPAPLPIAEDAIMLSRHTVPANRPVLLTKPARSAEAPAPAVAGGEPIPRTQTPRPVARFQVQRMSSVIAADARPAGAAFATPAHDAEPTLPDLPPVRVTVAERGCVERAASLLADDTELVPRPDAGAWMPFASRMPVRGPSLVIAPRTASGSSAVESMIHTAPPLASATPSRAGSAVAAAGAWPSAPASSSWTPPSRPSRTWFDAAVGAAVPASGPTWTTEGAAARNGATAGATAGATTAESARSWLPRPPATLAPASSMGGATPEPPRTWLPQPSATLAATASPTRMSPAPSPSWRDASRIGASASPAPASNEPAQASGVPAARTPRPREVSGLHESFFDTPNEDAPGAWEQTGRWRVMLLLALVVGLAVAAFLAPRWGTQERGLAPLPERVKKPAIDRNAGLRAPSTEAAPGMSAAKAVPAERLPAVHPADARLAGAPPAAMAGEAQAGRPGTPPAIPLAAPASPPSTPPPTTISAGAEAPTPRPEPTIAASSDPPSLSGALPPPSGPTAQATAVPSPGKGGRPAARPAAARAPAPSDTVDSAKRLAQAEALLRAEKSKDAERQFRAVLGAAPKNAQARSGLAMALYNLAKDSAASHEAKEAIALDPSTARAHLVAGLIATNKHDISAAKSAYQRYLELAPTGEYAEEVRRFLKAQN